MGEKDEEGTMFDSMLTVIIITIAMIVIIIMITIVIFAVFIITVFLIIINDLFSRCTGQSSR